jgi:anti-anti-sigma factor
MDARDLTISTAHDGGVCVLTVGGDLDLLAAGAFTAQAARAVAACRPERLVLDLAGLAFLDVRGAMALAAAVQAVPDGCPVIIRSISPAARLVLDLLDLDLTRPRQPAPGEQDRALLEQARTTRSRPAGLLPDILRVASAIAGTEERLAATLATMAGQQPHRAVRLQALSEHALQCAGQNRWWVDRHRQALADRSQERAASSPAAD